MVPRICMITLRISFIILQLLKDDDKRNFIFLFLSYLYLISSFLPYCYPILFICLSSFLSLSPSYLNSCFSPLFHFLFLYVLPFHLLYSLPIPSICPYYHHFLPHILEGKVLTQVFFFILVLPSGYGF